MSISDLQPSGPSPRLPLAHRLLGGALLLVALAASLFLVLRQVLDQFSLPGCGPQSDCEYLTAGPSGTLGGWPVSFVGLAFFSALLITWGVSSRHGFPRSGKWLTRLGLAGSLWFFWKMFDLDLWCAYCLAVHGANLAFWIVAESVPPAPGWRRPLIGFAVTWLAVCLGLTVVDYQVRQLANQKEEAKLQASIREIIAQSRSRTTEPPSSAGPGFCGRHGQGPQSAPIRIVVFTDYQCTYCQRLEYYIATALEGRQDVSYSVKHYPLCAECNPTILSPMHPNACRAARAAEAAGILDGSAAFWRMHHWLMRRRGRFDDEQLRDALPELGIADGDAFFRELDGDQAHARLKRDIDEAHLMEIHDTPRLFINGVQLRGLAAPDSVKRTLEALAAAGLPAHTAAADRPATKVDRLFAEWSKGPRVDIPAESRWSVGPKDASIRVVLFTDCLDENAEAATNHLLTAAAGEAGVRVEWFHFPAGDRHLEFARLLEAAGQLGGKEAFLRVHQWLLTTGADKTADEVLAAAATLKLDAAAWKKHYTSDAVRQAVDADIALGVDLDLKQSPAIFVAGRLIPDFVPPRDLFERIFASLE